jgi:hypothetical protein
MVAATDLNSLEPSIINPQICRPSGQDHVIVDSYPRKTQVAVHDNQRRETSDW